MGIGIEGPPPSCVGCFCAAEVWAKVGAAMTMLRDIRAAERLTTFIEVPFQVYWVTADTFMPTGWLRLFLWNDRSWIARSPRRCRLARFSREVARTADKRRLSGTAEVSFTRCAYWLVLSRVSAEVQQAPFLAASPYAIVNTLPPGPYGPRGPPRGAFNAKVARERLDTADALPRAPPR